jgi:hypothetical protein
MIGWCWGQFNKLVNESHDQLVCLQMFHRAIQSHQAVEFLSIVEGALIPAEGFGHLQAEAHRHLDVYDLVGPR